MNSVQTCFFFQAEDGIRDYKVTRVQTCALPISREFDPEGWQRMKAARALDGRGRAVLRELYLLRDRRARDLKRPPFQVLSDLFLPQAARRPPEGEEELLPLPRNSPGAPSEVGSPVLGS